MVFCQDTAAVACQLTAERAARADLKGKGITVWEGTQAHEGGGHRDASLCYKLPKFLAGVQASSSNIQHRLSCLYQHVTFMSVPAYILCLHASVTSLTMHIE